MDHDYSFLWLFAVVPDEPPSHEQQPLPDSSWFVVDELILLPHALCRPLAHAGRARRATISTVTVITAVQPTQTVRATVAAVLLPRSRRSSCHGRGGPLATVAAVLLPWFN